MFELHVTVNHTDCSAFEEVCEELDVKPLRILLQGIGHTDSITSSVIDGSLKDAHDKVKEISEFFKKKGFIVLREKIEAPIESSLPMLYMESRINVEVPDSLEGVENLCMFLHKHRHSLIYSKRGTNQIMTLRSYHPNVKNFHEDVHSMHELISKSFTVEPITLERCVMDTNTNHDLDWIRFSPAFAERLVQGKL
jgi:hypothetical protein